MSLRLVDVSRWQGDRADPLSLAAAQAAGYHIVNVALTGGKGYVSGPWAGAVLADAERRGMGRSVYHWLDGRTSGAAQAAVNLTRMRSLFGAELAGFAHCVDVEETGANGITPPTWQHVKTYVDAMQQALGRFVMIYTGDWFWPGTWPGGSITPYLMATPNDPLTSWPADDSPAWRAGYGGWLELSVMQWGIGPMPGTNVNCSLSVVRDLSTWAALTGETMASQAYYDWVADGRPWKFARPVKAVGDQLRAHGYTVYYQGNDDHLKHMPPEDHTAFSATGWPARSPYPYCMAADIMPPTAGQKSKIDGKTLPPLKALGARLRADRIAGHPGAAFVKYMNWEPEGDNTGPCRRDEWMPDHDWRASTDRGHIHVSSRTDFHLSTASDDYDLVARTREGDDMPITEAEFSRLETLMLKAVDVRLGDVIPRYNGPNLVPDTDPNPKMFGPNALAYIARDAAILRTELAAVKAQLAAAITSEVGRDTAEVQRDMVLAANVVDLATALAGLPAAVRAEIESPTGPDGDAVEAAVVRALAKANLRMVVGENGQ